MAAANSTGQLCACHGEPAYWNADKRRPAGGYWRCAVRHREQHNRYHHENREARLQARRQKQLAHWHAPDGGYIKRRRRTLAAQRADVLERLQQLEQEASAC